MDPNGILTTAAEIAIAIAGFSGITVAVGPMRTGAWTESAQVGLSVLLVMSASTLAFAFVPLVLDSAGVPARTAWVCASFLHACWLVGIGSYRRRQARRIPGNPNLRRTRTIVPGIVGCVIALQLANAFWLRAAWPFLVSIIAMNVGAFVVFAALLWALALSQESEE